MGALSLRTKKLKLNTMSDLKRKLAYNVAIKSYLNQLEILSGREILNADLFSLDDLERYRGKSPSAVCSSEFLQFKIPLKELETQDFRGYLLKLYEANSVKVIPWLHGTNACGYIFIDSICHVNLEISCQIFPEGIFKLLAEDCRDEMLLDFDSETVEIEIRGENWAKIPYEPCQP